MTWSEGGKTSTKSNHAWVAVQIRGLIPDPGVSEPPNAPPHPARPRTASHTSGGQASWCLIDPCWTAGHGVSQGGRLVFKKHFRDEYFLTRPELLILDHLPDESAWQLLPPANIMSSACCVLSQGSVTAGWRAISHPLTDIVMSAADFKSQPLRIRLEMCKPLETSGQSLKFRLYRAVGGGSNTYSAGQQLANVNGIGTSTGAASSAFILKVNHTGGFPTGLQYSVTCGSAAGVNAGNAFRIEAELGVKVGDGDTTGSYIPSKATYNLRLT